MRVRAVPRCARGHLRRLLGRAAVCECVGGIMWWRLAGGGVTPRLVVRRVRAGACRAVHPAHPPSRRKRASQRPRSPRGQRLERPRVLWGAERDRHLGDLAAGGGEARVCMHASVCRVWGRGGGLGTPASACTHAILRTRVKGPRMHLCVGWAGCNRLPAARRRAHPLNTVPSGRSASAAEGASK